MNIEQEKMKKQKYDLGKRLLEYSARIIKKIHSQNAHLPLIYSTLDVGRWTLDVRCSTFVF
jgi:hypothetical protein